MKQQHIYNGASVQHGSNRSTPFSDGGVNAANAKGMQQAAANLAGLGEQMLKMEDFSQEQKDEATLTTEAQNFDSEVERRLALPDGHSDSFHNSDGTLRQNKVTSLVDNYRKKFEPLGSEIIDPERRMRMQARAQHTINSMGGALLSRGAKEMKRKALINYQNNRDLALQRGDYASVLDMDSRAVGAALIPQSQADLQAYELQQAEYTTTAQNAWNQSPAELARLWDEGHFDEASADVQGNVQRMLARAGGLEIPQTQMRRVANKDGSERVEKLPPEAPRGLPSYLVRSWNENGGDFKTPDAKAASAPLLATWAKSQITSPNNPEEVERVKTVMKAYGASDAYASSIISTLQKDLGGGQTFNSSDSWDMMHEDAFFTEEQQDNIYWWKDRAAYLSTLDSAFLDEKKNEDGELLADELKRIKANLKEWDGYRKEENTKAKAAIEGEFIAWKSRNPDADYRDQYEEYWNITDRYLEKERGEQVDHTAMSAYQVGGNTAKEYENQVATAQKDMELARDENNKDVAQTEAMRNQPEEPLQEVQAVVEETSYPISTVRGASNALEGNTTEAILYVPKGTSMTDKEILIRAEGDIASYARVVESDKVTEPTMSRRLRGNLGDYTGQNKTITISGKNAYLSKQSSTQSNKAWATGGFAGELNPARLPAPLQPYAQDFIELGNKYGVNPALLAAISMHETGNGTSKAFKNRRNAMGISNSKGVIDQPSVRASIEHMARLMGRAKMYKGRELTEIASVYAPVGAGNDPRGYNQYWTRGVSQYLNQITN